MPESVPPAGFHVPYPILWLVLTALAIYFPTFSFQFTDLDDTIFIRDFHSYNEDLSNLFASFQRGLFDALKDPYYRPLFMDSIILNYQLSGMEATGYHIVNVLLHTITVVLLYRVFISLRLKELQAFLLTLIFAVHPVLSQAVAWIPGRNDTLLAIFVLAFLLSAIRYSDSGKIKSLVLSAIFLLLAFFTKETAAFAAPVAFVLIVFVLQKQWQNKQNLIQYAAWCGCFIVWYAARSMATIQTSGIASAQALSDLTHRLPVVVQYIGKILLPLNLSVFPIQGDTVYYYGIAAIAILAALLFFGNKINTRYLIGGLGVFILFLMPALLVPMKLNEQTFEHRLYLPFIGILLVLSQSVLLRNKFSDKATFIIVSTLCGLLAVVNYNHQQNFSDPRTFWTSAVQTSPNSAYANMMLAARLDKSEFEQSCALYRKAYALNPKEKYLNFYLGDMLQKKDSVLASEPYLLAEQQGSGYYQCDFLLARVAMEKKDMNGAIQYMETYLKTDVNNKSAQSNLLLMYIDNHQPDKAKAQAKRMKEMGLEIPPQLHSQLGM